MDALIEESQSDPLSTAVSFPDDENALLLATDDASTDIALSLTEPMVRKRASLNFHHISGSKQRSVEAVAHKTVMILSSFKPSRLFSSRISSMIERHVAEDGDSGRSLMVNVLFTCTIDLMNSSSFNISLRKRRFTARASLTNEAFSREVY